MARIIKYGGGLLLQGGSLVSTSSNEGEPDPGCCCGDGVCCEPDCGASWGVDFLPDQDSQDGFASFLAGRGYLDIGYSSDPATETAFWTAQCCKSDPADVADFTVTGTAGGAPNSTIISVPLCLISKLESAKCVEGLTTAECVALGGTVSPASSCTPDPCATDSCPPGGLCPCPGSGVQPLFDPSWPGSLAIGPAYINCEDDCQYSGGANGAFSCAEVEGSCSWAVSVCAQISCDSINEETGCGSECSVTGVTVAVNTESCACPDELPDYSGFNYFYCP